MSAPTRFCSGARAGGRGPKSSAEVSARKPESESKKPAESRPCTRTSGPGCAPIPAGSTMPDVRPGLAEQVAHALGLPERLGGDEHRTPRRDGGEARPESGEPAPAPRRSRAVNPKVPGRQARRSPAIVIQGRAAGNPSRLRPEVPVGDDEVPGERREQRRPRRRLERRQQPQRRLVAVGALRPDVEGAQRRHATRLVFDPDGVLRRPPGRRRSGPAAARTRRRPPRSARAGTPSRPATRRETPVRPRPRRAGRSHRRSTTPRRKPVRAQPRDPRRRRRHPRRRLA